jgi:hypothetical protein
MKLIKRILNMSCLTNLVFNPGLPFVQEMQLFESELIPLDLLGCSLRMQIRKTVEDSTVLVELSSSNGKIIIVDAALGIFKLSLTGNETLNLKSGVYDIELTFVDSTIVPKVLSGEFIADLTVTR